MKKLFALLLCLLMVVAVVIGCAESGIPKETGDGTKAPGTQGTSGQESEPAETLVKDDLPAKMDFDGMTIRTAYRDGQINFFPGEDEGEIVATAVYNANMAVEERLNITRTWDPINDSILTMTIIKSIMTGDDMYDYVPVDQFYGSEYCAQGMYMDLSDLPYVDYEKPWYYKEYMESLSLGEGTIFYVSGDVYPITSAWTSAIFWNKTLYSDVIDTDMLSLYKLVDEGGWTYDKYNQMVRQAYLDLDKNGEKSAGDRFGTINSNHGCEHMSFSMGFTITEKNDLGYYDVILDTEKNHDITELIRAHYYDNEGFYLYSDAVEGAEFIVDKFANDECLFAQQFFCQLMSETIRNMRSEFGVVPLPKYDENQKDYIGTIHNSAFLLGVPVNVNTEKIEAIGALIEAQGSENYRSVRPVFFEDALKSKYNRDEENAAYTNKMIDLICSNYRIDFAYVYSNACNDLGRIIHSAIEEGVSLSQVYAARESQIQQGLTDLFESFEEYKSENMT